MGALQFADPYFQVYRALAREFDLPIDGLQATLAAFGGGHQRGQLDTDGVVYTDYLIHGGRLKDEAVQLMAPDARGPAVPASPSSIFTRRCRARKCRPSPTRGRTALPSSSCSPTTPRFARCSSGKGVTASATARCAICRGAARDDGECAEAAPDRTSRSPVLVAAGSLLVLARAGAAGVPERLVYVDRHGHQVIQSTELSDRAFSRWRCCTRRTISIRPSIPAFRVPFVFLSAGKWQSTFSVVLRPGGRALALLASSGLSRWRCRGRRRPHRDNVAGRRPPVSGALLLLATPVWLYGLTPNETALALGLSRAAIASPRASGPRGD